jgi:hypothetical protein
LTRRLAFPLAFVLAVSVFSGVRALAGADAPKSVNLDSDPNLERVVPRRLCEASDGTLHPPQPSCADEQFPVRRIEVEDTCHAMPYVRSISSVQDFVAKLRVTEADGSTPEPEIFFDLRSGATGRGGDVRVLHYGGATGDCPGRRDLFRYPAKRTLGPLPKGAAGHDSFSVFLANYSRRYRGKEIRVVETYVDRDDAFCCPSFKRTSFFRFSRSKGIYVRYRSHSRRIKKRD